MNYLKETIQQNRQIEKPTARLYFEKFIGQNKEFEGVNPDIIKSKVQTFKKSYQGAVNWLNNTGQGVEDGDNIRSYLKRICPYYEILNEIYGERPSVHIPVTVDTGADDNGGTSDYENEVFTPAVFEPMVEEFLDDSNEFYIDNHATPSPPDNHAPAIRERADKRKAELSRAGSKTPRYVKNSLVQLTEIQKSRNEIQEKKIDVEVQRLKLENEWQEKKLKLEEKKIEMEERIRMAEIEKDERVARYNLELKYGIQKPTENQ